MKKTKTSNYLILLLLLFFIVTPIATVFLRAIIIDGRLNFSQAAQLIFTKDNLLTIKNSLLLGILVVICASLIATPLGFIFTKSRLAKYKWLEIIFMIPFMTPPYILSMGWILFCQKRGLFQQLFPATGNFSEKFFSLFGLVMVMSLHIFPFMTNIIKNSIGNISANMDESAKISGAGLGYRLRKIIFPLLTGNYAIGMLLVFIKTLSEYGTPATIGRRIGFIVFTTDIHRYATVAPISFGKAASLSSILVIICMLMRMVQNRVTEKNTYNLVGQKSARTKDMNHPVIFDVLAVIYLVILIIFSIGIPYFSIIATSLINLRGYGLKAGNFTGKHYVDLFQNRSAAKRALLTSFGLGAATAIICAIFGTFIVVSLYRQGKWKKYLENIAILPEMIPNIVFVIGLMIFWNKIYNVMPLYNTLGFMVLVYSVMFLPFTIQYVSSSFLQMGDNLIQAAKISGASRSYTFRKIILPLIAPSISSAAMMTFIISFRELVASSIISPPNVMTVSTFITSEFEQGSVSVGMAMAVVCVLITTSLLIIINVLNNRRNIK